MPRRELRQIKKPRPSLSCIVCRRRKVRCGREQPACANCVRMEEKCMYKTTVRDDSTSQVHQVSPEPYYRNSSGPTEPHAKEPIGSSCVSEDHRQVDMSCLTEPSLEKDSTNGRDVTISDYLSLRRGGRARYIGQSFWGLVAGKVSMLLICARTPIT